MTLRTDLQPVYYDFEGVAGIWVDGSTPPTQYSDFVELEKLEITLPTQEPLRLIGRRTSTKGNAIASINIIKDSTASIKIMANTYTPDLLAMAMGASSASETTQTTGAVVDEAVTTALNVWIPLANQGLSTTGVSLKDALDVAVAADKYEVDHELGMIKAVHADAVGVGMQISYTKGDRTWETYAGGSAVSKYVHITGKATNQISGKIGLLDIWKANLASDSPFVMPSGDAYFQGSFAGDLITPTVAVRGVTPSSPWYFRDRTA